ncbi:hypothetical protein SPI_02398 [Niveomyces insectorum RCEF 264]|uniref:Rhodopsin domain-containing protein n=1 Tax=Niveomyces insectorum RCEF 264 TaxID=1081102 RepID=A0A167XZ74_9HYPO|nr:hypothetical protein SPI_02398 [Niveomyces insectorum RCEF 264]
MEHPLTPTPTLVQRATGAVAAVANGTPLALLPHDNQGPQLNFTIWLLTGLSLGFLSLRVYCKFLRGRGLWWDDYVLISSWVALALASAFTTACTAYGYGKHLWDIPPANFPPLNVVSTIAGTFSILAAAWSKTSFAMTVLRISTGWMRWTIWFIIMSVNVVLGVSAIFQWIHCVPVQRIFDGTVKGTCWDADVTSYYNTFASAYSGTVDMVLAMFPWKIIWGMSMNRKEKTGVLFAMSMGVFAGVASFIKVSKVGSLTNPDPGETVQLVIWGVAESAITIIAASIPILRALLRDGKLSNAPRSDDEIELNTASSAWSASGAGGSRSSGAIGGGIGGGFNGRGRGGCRFSSSSNGSSFSHVINSAIGSVLGTATTTAAPVGTTTATTATATTTLPFGIARTRATGAPTSSWLTAPVTVTPANQNPPRAFDGRRSMPATLGKI